MNEQKALMDILSAVIHGNSWDKEYMVNGHRLYALAQAQGVHIIIFPTFEEMYNKGLLEMTQGEFETIRRNTMRTMLQYTQRQFAAYTLLGNMRSVGIPFVLMKGDTLSYLYAHPEYRVSGDIDILIDKKREEDCCRFFREHGADVSNRAADNNERVVTHKTAGVIEVHVDFNTKTVSEVWYDHLQIIQEPFRDILLFDQFQISCMGHTDTAINMLLHFIKHYISGVAHLRMFVDTLLYIDREYQNIDWERFNDTIQKLKYHTIFKCMIYIGERYLNLKKIHVDDMIREIASEFFADIFTCGQYSFESSQEIGCYEYYSERKYEKANYNHYQNYQKQILFRKIIYLLFPDSRTMRIKYPILKGHMFLLPIFYFYRLITVTVLRPFRKKKMQQNKGETSLKNDRIELINKLNMI